MRPARAGARQDRLMQTSPWFRAAACLLAGWLGCFAFAAPVYDTNSILFLVGSYTFNPIATNDDVSQLWINPAPSSFGEAAVPPATLTNGAGNDLSQLASFVLFNRSASEPA